MDFMRQRFLEKLIKYSVNEIASLLELSPFPSLEREGWPLWRAG